MPASSVSGYYFGNPKVSVSELEKDKRRSGD
jgi:hypothetical protein